MPIDNVRFDFKGVQYQARRVFIDFDQPTNPNTGRPNGPTKLSRCVITLNLGADDDLQAFYDWEKDYHGTEDVTVDFYSENQAEKTYKFEDTFLTSIENETTYAPGGGVTRIVTLYLSPMKATVEGTYFDFSKT